MPDSIRDREFKLLLKPERFPTRRALLEFNRLFEKNAATMGVYYEPIDTIDSQLRYVQFYDTVDQSLRRNDLILRFRQLLQTGWPDKSWEVTFKCRASELDKVAGFDVSSNFPQQTQKLKEEMLRGTSLGSLLIAYSNNCILESPDLDLELPLGNLVNAFPCLEALNLDLTRKLTVVNDAKILEIQAHLGSLFFGHRTRALATLALWTEASPDHSERLIAEFGWAYHQIPGKNGKEVDRVADRFFRELQQPLKTWIALGGTKTDIVYSAAHGADEGNAPSP